MDPLAPDAPDLEPIDIPDTAAGAAPPDDELCSKQVYDELYSRYQRLQADFDNHRKRAERERREYQAQAVESLMGDLLPVLDNLELAVRHARETGEAPAITDGVAMVQKQFQALLERQGLESIEAMGAAFDPRFHEAVARIESNLHAENTVLEEYQRGYTLGGRVLRPARVGVSSLPAPPGEKDR